MHISFIIPLWLMIIISGFLIFFVIKFNQKNKFQLLLIALLFLINIRFHVLATNTLTVTNNLDVLFVIDNSQSMNAMDYNGENPRLSAVKNDCKKIINELTGARFSLITFNNRAKIVVPFTRDEDILLESIDILNVIEKFYAQGSSLNSPIELMQKTLEDASKKENRLRIVFYISDGEITDKTYLASYKKIKDYVNDGAVLGYGTPKGGYMKTKDDYSGNETYVMDYSGSYGKAISKIDENNLKTIAKDLNIDYLNMNNPKNIEAKLKKIKNNIFVNSTENNQKTFNDIYFIFACFLLIGLMFEFYNLRRNKN